MNIIWKIKYWGTKRFGILRPRKPGFPINWILVALALVSCEVEQHSVNWFDEESLTICQFLEKNKEEYSKSYRLLTDARMLNPLCGYNPYGEGYTLFLPTNEALELFILKNEKYEKFDDMLKDTSFIYKLARYHTLSRKIHSHEFPDGALADTTLNGKRLAFGFYAEGNDLVIKINNKVPLVKPNLEMNNGYIHVVSDVLQPIEISGYDWLQQNDEYSILAKAMELTRIKYRLWWKEYTIFAEHDSVFNRKGIKDIDDLITRFTSQGSNLANKSNPFNQFISYHLVGGSYYLNELKWGNKTYTTMSEPLIIDVGFDIRVNPGVESYGFTVSDSGDSTVIDYIRLVRENCNNTSTTGPIHSISDLLYFEPFPR